MIIAEISGARATGGLVMPAVAAWIAVLKSAAIALVLSRLLGCYET